MAGTSVPPRDTPESSSEWTRVSTTYDHQGDEEAGGDEDNRDSQTFNGFNTKPTATTSAQSFTPRSLLVGLFIGTLIVFSNTYFGLQTGWMSTMSMPSSLIGFAIFKSLSKHLSFPFTPVENVLIQTVAGAVGTMPLGCGFVGVIPAMEYLLREGDDGPQGGGGKGEGGPLNVGFWKLVIWSLGVCLFGAVFAIPLRREVIIREKLRFPTGTATALMIRVLHGNSAADEKSRAAPLQVRELGGEEENDRLLAASTTDETIAKPTVLSESRFSRDWKAKIRLLLGAFVVSAFYTIFSYFVPQVRDLPIFGLYLARDWLWTLNPSPAYVGQGIIMGTSTSLHMLFGAVIGWAILSPIAKNNNWAPGPVDDWDEGSKGWIIWVSLAIMLADAVINLGWLILKALMELTPAFKFKGRSSSPAGSWTNIFTSNNRNGYTALHTHSDSTADPSHAAHSLAGPERNEDSDAPASQLISTRTVIILLPVTLALNVLCMHIAFGNVITPLLSFVATLLALVLSIMGVRALGETDLNPVSGISKLTQLIFAIMTPASHFTRRPALITNLLAGAVSEAGALQAGDMMQDLKTGHILGASPKAQFYGQLIGSVFGAVIATAVYRLYVSVYEVPGDMFQIPAAQVWISTARLVTGQGLPPMAWETSIIAGVIFVATTVVRIVADSKAQGGHPPQWKAFIPGGIAVAVGMFNVPSFTLARAIGGVIAWWYSRSRVASSPGFLRQRMFRPWRASVNQNPNEGTANTAGEDLSDVHGSNNHEPTPSRGQQDNPVNTDHQDRGHEEQDPDSISSTVVVLASGLILGEGILSIVNLGLASAKVPHL